MSLSPVDSFRLSVTLLLVVGLLTAGAGVYAAASATDSTFIIDTYDGPPEDQREPGATDRSYWTESVIRDIPEDEKVFLQRSITYRPVFSDCGAGDIDELGIDRDATNEGERETDESVGQSVQSFGLERETSDQFEEEIGADETLTTADWEYVERLEVEWYGPDDFGGPPVEIYHGDRFVTAQSECLDNPDAEGWYRWAAFNEGEFENGTTVEQEGPAFSEWFYICDCEDREAAVETLGPPPSADTDGTKDEKSEATPTPTATPAEGDAEESTTRDDSSEDDEDSDESMDSPTPTATATPAPTDTPEPTPTPTPPPEWDDLKYQTPAEEQGIGIAPFVVAVLLVAFGALRRRN